MKNSSLKMISSAVFLAALAGCAQGAGTAQAASAPAPSDVAVSVATPAANQVNTTGLPDYPGVSGAIMDNVYRDLLGHSCIHYMVNTPDDLGKVEAWFRSHMAGAKETPVNSDNMYGGYFKLDGIKLEHGHDFANIYRTARQKDTSVELFKCKN